MFTRLRKSLSAVRSNLFSRTRRRGTVPPRTFRPGVERLEERNLFNVSSVFDALGHLAEVIVRQDGSLTLQDQTGAHVLYPSAAHPTSDVRVAHAFLDAHGKVGIDVVFKDGTAESRDFTGIHPILPSNPATEHIIDASRVVGKHGNFKLDLVTVDTGAAPFGPDLRGKLTEFTKTGSTVLIPDNVRWATVYLDRNGKIGHASGVVAAGGNLVVTREDSTGTRQLYNSPDGATQDMTDYSQTRSKTGRVVTDITFGRFAGTYTLEFRSSGIVMIGNGTDIGVGG